MPEEYWSLDATLEGRAPPPFLARLSAFDGEKLKFDGSDPRLPNETAAKKVSDDVSGAVWKVASVETSERRKNPAPPFITSQLQQDAARRLGFAVRRTMQLAQRLYEGREIGGRGTVGLITYMRTDSTRVSEEALTAVREYIGTLTGRTSLPESAALLQEPSRDRRTRTRRSGRRSSTFRPTRSPIRRSRRAQLYRLIWNRFVASQMAPAVFDTTAVEITAGARSTGPPARR